MEYHVQQYHLFLTTPSSLPFLLSLLQAWVHINLDGFFLPINNRLALAQPNITGYMHTNIVSEGKEMHLSEIVTHLSISSNELHPMSWVYPVLTKRTKLRPRIR